MNQFLKIYLKLLFILFICSLKNQLNAQSDCATLLSNSQFNYLTITQNERETISADLEFNNTIPIPVVVHLVEIDSTGVNSTLNETDVNYALDNLNDGFFDTGFQFNLCSINYIDYSAGFDSIYYSLHPTGNEFLLASSTAEERALNIYFVQEALSQNGNSVCGWSSFPGELIDHGKQWIIMDKDCAKNGSTLIHEVGHFFNLYHTHQGENFSLGINELELANSQNGNCGSNVGDELCDTPAEPYRSGKGLGGIVNEDCEILCEYRDSENDVYIPALDGSNYNFMSYAPYKCRNHFTPDQVKRMKISYLVDRNYLSEICPGEIVDIQNNTCNQTKETKALLKLFAAFDGHKPDDWAGLEYNMYGCVTHINIDGTILANQDKLTGSLPLQIEDFVQLESLILINHNICGNIPSSIGNLKKLEVLNLSNNQIAGSIPIEIAMLENLKTLNLAGNELCGYIPHQLSTLTNLSDIELSGNPFSGCLHPSLQNLVSLQEIDLEICTNCNEDDWLAIKRIYNDMEGSLSPKMSLNIIDSYFNAAITNPPTECDLSNIKFLHLNDYGRVEGIKLGSYELSGPIPTEIALLSDLEILVLDYNQITGKIPESISTLSKLKYVNLWENSLDNCLPVALTKLCGQTSIGMLDFFSFDFYNDFCAGKGGYCEAEAVEDYVMPGDFNNDKKVSNADLVFWQTSFGTSSGIVRENAQNAWLPQACEDWSDEISGVNLKHQDANGDGMIDIKDLEVFHTNFGKGDINQPTNNFDGVPINSTANLKIDQTGEREFSFKIINANSNEQLSDIKVIIFTIAMGESNYNDVYFDYNDAKPIGSKIERIEGTNYIEFAQVWGQDNPPPIDESYGRLIVAIADDTDEETKITFTNIQIISNEIVYIDSDGFDVSFDTGNTLNTDEVCKDQDVTGDIFEDITYSAPNKIISPIEFSPGVFGDTYINGCADVIFKSGGSIVLNPGFKNQHGTVFCAQIEYCEPSPAKNALIEQSELSIYPNPTKNQATIAFDLANTGTVSLSITDITGKQITNLINNITKEKGKHNIAYNTGKLPTGVYYCTLKHHETISTQKLIVVK